MVRKVVKVYLGILGALILVAAILIAYRAWRFSINSLFEKSFYDQLIFYFEVVPVGAFIMIFPYAIREAISARRRKAR